MGQRTVPCPIGETFAQVGTGSGGFSSGLGNPLGSPIPTAAGGVFWWIAMIK